MIRQQIKIINRTGAKIGKTGLQLARRLSRVMGSMAKRAFDILVSLVGLFLLSPLFVFLGALIKLDSAGPVFYRGKRIGKAGKPFWMYKFRTMQDIPAVTGPRITACDDPRVTRAGRLLRDTKLNELPQLINVLKGEMSLVGPRPEDPKYVALYTPRQRRVLSVRLGITSMASIIYRDEENMLSQDTLEDTYINVIMPDKLRLDMEYIDHRSFLVDLDILFRTLVVLLPRFAQATPEIEEILFGPVQSFIRRRLSWFTLDFILALGAVLTTKLIWRGGFPRHASWPIGVVSSVGIALTFTLMNQLCGLQRSMWSFASGQDIIDIVLSTTFSTTLLLAINRLGLGWPLEKILLNDLLALTAFTAARYHSRLITGLLLRWRNLWSDARHPGRKRLLIVGTSAVGEFLARQVKSRPEGQRYQIVGFVDDDLSKRGMRIHGVEVLGSCRAIPTLVTQHDVDVVVVTLDGLGRREHQAIVDACRHTLAQVKVIPDVLQFIREADRPLLDDTEREIASFHCPTDDEANCPFVANRAALATVAHYAPEET